MKLLSCGPYHFSPLGAALLFTLLAACDQIRDLTGPSPEKVLTAYFEATKAGNWDAAYAHISTQDQAAKPLAVYKSEVTGDNALAAAVLSKTSYKVLSVERQGNRAKASVEVTSPDLSGMFIELLQKRICLGFWWKGYGRRSEAGGGETSS